MGYPQTVKSREPRSQVLGAKERSLLHVVVRKDLISYPESRHIPTHGTFFHLHNGWSWASACPRLELNTNKKFSTIPWGNIGLQVFPALLFHQVTMTSGWLEGTWNGKFAQHCHVPSGYHDSWMARGNMEWEVCPALPCFIRLPWLLDG